MTSAGAGDAPSVDDRAFRDNALIAQYRAGRAPAVEELLAAYDLPVRRTLAKLAVAPCDVDDLTQDVLLRVYRNLHRFRGQSSFSTWLYRITVNVRFDDAKKRRRADERLSRLQRALVATADPLARDGDPYLELEYAATRGGVIAAVDALPNVFRTVAMMRGVDDLSYEEIAEKMHLSVGTVRSRLARARSRLKHILRSDVLSGAA